MDAFSPLTTLVTSRVPTFCATEYVLLKYASTTSPSDANKRPLTALEVSVGSTEVPDVVTNEYVVEVSPLFSVTEYVPKGMLFIVYVATPDASTVHPAALPSIVAISDVPLLIVNERYCLTSSHVLSPETFL